MFYISSRKVETLIAQDGEFKISKVVRNKLDSGYYLELVVVIPDQQ